MNSTFKKTIPIMSVFLASFASVAMDLSKTKGYKSESTVCRKIINPSKKKETSIYCIDHTAIMNEKHELWDLIDADESVNLVAKHPSIVMSAAQRVLSWSYFKEPRTMKNPEFNDGNITYYPVFSAGIPEAGYKRINGQYSSVEAFVDHVKAAARGDGSANKMLLFIGPSGTGKTYFLNILSSVAENLTASHPDYFMYTYEWINLREYPELEPFVNTQRTEQGIYEHPYKCPINESPFSLLPEEYRNPLVESATGKVMSMTGVAPTPFTHQCPHCHEIKNQILKAHMIKNDLKSLDEYQIVEALAPHVRIKRLVVGTNGTMTKLDAQPKDVDYQGLFVAPNAFTMHSYGQSHPGSYYLSGKTLQAHGTMIMFDEYLRNAKDLRDAALDLVENREVSRGGAPTVKMDALVIGATNNESLEAARTNETSKAHIDRTRRVRMPYLLNPWEEAANLLAMKNIKTVSMQKLGEMSARKVDANLDILFPLPENKESRVGPDGRYKIWFNVGPEAEPIHLSPHTLMYIALVATGSRLVVDPAKALEFGERQVINDVAYRDVYVRLQILMGRYNVNASDWKDLRSLSRDQKEGDSGMTERDVANVWLTQAILDAQKNGNCLTPDIAHKVLLRLLEDGAIEYKDNRERIRWSNLSNELLLRFMVPSLMGDVNTALGAGLGAVNTLYDEVFKEILELSSDERATKYQSARGEPRLINKQRLEEIKKLYELTERRTFSFQEVVLHLASKSSDTSDTKRHPGLVRAVTNYLAQREADKITYDDLMQFSDTREGNSELREKHTDLSHVMRHELGYCDKCLNSALMIVRQAKSRVNQVK